MDNLFLFKNFPMTKFIKNQSLVHGTSQSTIRLFLLILVRGTSGLRVLCPFVSLGISSLVQLRMSSSLFYKFFNFLFILFDPSTFFLVRFPRYFCVSFFINTDDSIFFKVKFPS